MRILCALALAVTSSLFPILESSAQSPLYRRVGPYGYDKCLEVHLSKRKIKEIETEAAAYERRSVNTNATISVPVYVHIIQNSNGDNTATSEQIDAQIELLNTSYAGRFSFTLVSTDTTVNDDWFNLSAGSDEERDMKTALYAGDSTALNIYLTFLADDLLGFATFPWDYEFDPSMDGVVVQYSSLPGGTAVPYDLGVTTVHEVGHWLGLLHTFQDSRVRDDGCSGGGDLVSDTPAEKIPHYRCKASDSCRTQRGKDPIRNFMNYTPDACQRSFTRRQFTRMNSMYQIYRES